MDLYHIYCDLKPGVSDRAFCQHLDAYLGHLQAQGLIHGWRTTRAKLGFGNGLGDWHIMIEIRDLKQLEDAFQTVASRSGDVEGFHACVNQLVTRSSFALYRDFPDPVRRYGEERF